MKLKKNEESLLKYLIEHEDEIKKHFNEWYTWKEMCKILGLKYSSDTRKRSSQQSAVRKFTNLKNNGESTQNLKFTMKGFTELYYNKKNNIEHITMQEFELAYSQLDDTTLRKRYAKNLLIHLFLKIVANSNDEEEREKYMDSSDITQWYVTRNDLYKTMGITSQSANFALKNIDDFCKELKIDVEHKDIVQDHFNVDEKWQYDTLNNTLKYLSETLHVISYTDKAYKIEMIIGEKTSPIEDTFEIVPRTTYTTLDEIEWINAVAIPKALSKMSEEHDIKLKSLKDLRLNNLEEEFYKKYLVRTINECVPYWFSWGEVLSVTKCYRIGFNFEIIDLIIQDTDRVDLGITQNEIDELNHLKEINVNETVSITRKETVDKRQESTIKRHKDALKKEEDDRTEVEKVRAKYEYVEVGYMVNTELHNSKTKYRKYKHKPRTQMRTVARIKSKK